MKKLEDYVTTIPDFPKPGIMFRDVTTIIQDKDGFELAIDGLSDCLKDVEYDLIAGSESRGFIFSAPLAYKHNKGKLPREVISQEYDLEYGTATLEVHADSIKPGDCVVIVDDLVATGGTTMAMIKMVEKLGGTVVKLAFVMELKGLKGREALAGYDMSSLIAYEGI